MKIAVYSGSFDPLHVGHLSVMRHLASCGLFDATYLVVSPQSPFKNPGKADNAPERYEAAVRAAARYPELRIKADDIELHMPPPQFTLLTLEALRDREPGNQFTLVIGADNLAVFRGWQGYQRILSDFGVVVYPRRGVNLAAVREDLLAEEPDYRIDVIDAPLVDVSSTYIREAVSEGRDVSSLLM